jgi:hypothetical protein
MIGRERQARVIEEVKKQARGRGASALSVGFVLCFFVLWSLYVYT